MPAGLDGNPNPIVTSARAAALDEIAARVLEHAGPRTLVAVDGQSGAGKSTFADEVAQRLSGAGRTPIRSTTDSFHRPRAERLKGSATSAEGYLDSHQLGAIVDDLLQPFSEGAAEVRTAAFDEPSDSALNIRAPSVGLDDLLDPDQVADYLGVLTGTLANWRYRGEGPPFVHVGRLVRYRAGDLAAWIEAHLHISSR